MHRSFLSKWVGRHSGVRIVMYAARGLSDVKATEGLVTTLFGFAHDHERPAPRCGLAIFGAVIGKGSDSRNVLFTMTSLGAMTPIPAPGREERPVFQNGLVASTAAGTGPALVPLPAYPPRLPPRSSRGFASLTVSARPLTSWPFRAATAASSFLTTAHFDKAETFRAARVAVHDDLG